MKRHFLYIILLYLLLINLSCTNSQGQKIDRIEKEFKVDCSFKDSCLSFQTIFYKDGSYLKTYFVRYPDMKIVTFFNPENTWLYEMKVTGKDSIKTEMVYDTNGDLLKIIYSVLSVKSFDEIEEFKNDYDSKGRIIKQIKIDRRGNLVNSYSYHYDTLEFSKIIVEENIQDSILTSTKFYQKDKLVKQINYDWPTAFQFSYDEKDRLIFEDLIHAPQLRKFYTYKEGLIIQTEKRFKKKDGAVYDEIFELEKYEYKFDDENRPVLLTKTTYRYGKLVYKTITEIQYK